MFLVQRKTNDFKSKETVNKEKIFENKKWNFLALKTNLEIRN